MEHRVTQCPRCGTSFRVTEAHLAVAAGAVRCGSCLHIFNARDHWADTLVAADMPAPRQQQPEPDIDIHIDDDLLIDDNTPLFADEDDEPTRRPVYSTADEDFSALEMAAAGHGASDDAPIDLDGWEQESTSLFRELSDTDTDIEDDADEQWAQRLLQDVEREEPTLGAMAEPFAVEAFDYAEGFDEATATVAVPAARDELTANLSREFLEVPDAGSITPPKPVAAPEQEEETEPAVTLASIRADDRIGGDVSRRLFESFETEPLQLHHPLRHEPVWPKVLWGAGLVLALALLAAQYLYFNFDSLARGPLRPRVAEFCSTFNCALPAQFDVGRIHTGSLIVRSHPTNHGALAVDAIITNQADFPQPYPELQLQFTDLDGAPVAGRRFKPEEYLGGELTGSRLMPAMQPVHIALELLDPGPRAVNYLLTVVPGTTAQ